MEPIVVATDLSPAGDSAVQYAAGLAQSLQRPLHLLHAFMVPTGISELPLQPEVATLHTYPVSYDALRAEAEEGLRLSVTRVQQAYPGLTVVPQAVPAVGVSNSLLDAVEPLKPLCLVLGTHPRHGFTETFDSRGLDLLRMASFPLLTVPQGYSGAAPTQAALAVDGRSIAPAQLATVRRLATTLGLQLDIVHVQTGDGEHPSCQELLQQLSGLPVHLHTVRNDDVTEGLHSFLQQSGAQLLLQLPHHHNFWERLFGKQHTADIVSEINVPVLVIPEGT
ncbi:universal stress protein [Flaviaesturariibacter amylovorans]|uniref:UspA domain-containing protein n=1 Tax=Flaviaesturariibacter amylovorans TaxID=1084520 RepID=A0ABP8HFD2_9BACT